jgi:hypothetical protein
MSIQAVLLPVFVQVALTFVLLFAMGSSRFAAVRANQVKVIDAAASNIAWPRRAAQVSRSFHNQLETPLLFYVVVILAIITKRDDAFFVTCEWLWVATRVAHALVHISSNRLQLRFPLFLAGVIILIVMWITFALRILAP